MSQRWCLKDITQAAEQLYSQMFKPGAREPQARAFWEEVLDALIDSSHLALRRRAEQAPTTDALSEHRRRRVDLVLDAFINDGGARVTVIFTEMKKASGTRDDLITVEKQAYDACKAYISSDECPVSVVYGMCVLGPQCRIFRYTNEEAMTWTPMWGTPTNYDSAQYINAADPRSLLIWRTLNSILQSPHVPLAGKEFLRLNLPPQNPQPTLQSQSAAVPDNGTSAFAVAAGQPSCASCMALASPGGHSPVLALSPTYHPPVTLAYPVMPSPSVVVMHDHCYQELMKYLTPRDHRESDRLIYILGYSKSPAWPLPLDFYHVWTAQLAGRSFCDAMRRNDHVRSIFYDLKRKAIPDEVMQLVGEYSFPCALTDWLVTRENLLAIASIHQQPRRSRTIHVADNMIIPVYANILQHKYVSDIRTLPNGTSPRSMGIWVKDITSARSFYESYLWSQPAPPTLLPQHCFGLPAVDLSLQDTIDHPIRLRQTKLNGPLTGIIAACSGGQLLGVSEAAQSHGELYTYVDQLGLDSTTIWLYFPIQAEEHIVEVCIRRLESDVSALCEDSVVLLTSLGRLLVCGPSVFVKDSGRYNFHTLVNDPDLEPGELYLTEAGWRPGGLRAGVVCQTSRSHEKVHPLPRPHAWLNQEVPIRPTSVGHGRYYWFKVDVQCFDEFDLWLEARCGITTCRGIRFRRARSSVVMGEWRLDVEVQTHSLPSAVTICNVKVAGRNFVTMNVGPENTAIHITGVLEWWIGPKGWEVIPGPNN
ncbi:hypothetical protein AC579_2863 [Pseudocercospora musae]|uniref:Uncharacterized protein n=1 Tax=Pseudocercospora musae TaxID=113226 RepID=A0A139GT41_9PEZI|nr:hypothetical protein AC579_2863 [Pseudocercospora musae]